MSVSQPSGSLTPEQLRQLVFDYLCHNCYTETARAFKRASTVRQLDADGDEVIEDVASEDNHRTNERFEEQLRQIELRNEIRMHIMSGRVDEAIELLDQHFPSVLSEDTISSEADESRPTTNETDYVSSTSTEPSHLNLNLRILAFSEACRTIPLHYPPKADESASEDSDEISPEDAMETDDEEESSEAYDKQVALLQRAQKLYAYTVTLPNPGDRAIYLKELENVGGLLAYKIPENSSMAKYLTLERREAVADQIGRAILQRMGKPITSTLEILTRHTQVLWDYARDCKMRPGAIVPPRNVNDTSGGDIPAFDLPTFLDAKP